jgi:hypothetical protein
MHMLMAYADYRNQDFSWYFRNVVEDDSSDETASVEVIRYRSRYSITMFMD